MTAMRARELWLALGSSFLSFFLGSVSVLLLPDLFRQQLSEAFVGELSIASNERGQFLATGNINGERVRYLIDTGATKVSVPLEIAEAAGLELGQRRRILSADGHQWVYASVIERISLGPIELGQVPALINPSRRSGLVFLGMSFLRQLSIRLEGGRMKLALPARAAGETRTPDPGRQQWAEPLGLS